VYVVGLIIQLIQSCSILYVERGGDQTKIDMGGGHWARNSTEEKMAILYFFVISILVIYGWGHGVQLLNVAVLFFVKWQCR